MTIAETSPSSPPILTPSPYPIPEFPSFNYSLSTGVICSLNLLDLKFSYLELPSLFTLTIRDEKNLIWGNGEGRACDISKPYTRYSTYF